ncbi:MAG: glycosyltransferase family 4 protein [Brevinematales bacterium]|nr:glycosyltransferase family 4 protein [Brevinematales bacterium]
MESKYPLRVCVDARPLLHKGGITRYTYEMISALAKIPEVSLVLIAHKDFPVPENLPIIKVVDTRFSFLPGTLWFLWRAPTLAKKHRCQILWGTQHTLPLKTSRLFSLVTWHDVVWKKAPSSMRMVNRLLNTLLASMSVRQAKRILCVSHTTEEDLIRYYPNAKGKTTVIYEGKSLPDTTSATCPYTFPFLFTLGSLEPRKNILALLKVFEKLVLFPGYEEYRLVITGPQGWKNHHVFRYLDNSALREKVILTGYLSDEDLIAYFKACRLFIFPSLYEGFGLPLLEAEGKAPVVANDIPVFRELEKVFENLWLCDFSHAPEKIASFLTTLIEKNPSPLTFRKGKELSWEKAGKAFVKTLGEIS